MRSAPTIIHPRCHRCGSKLSYEGRPCRVCISPAGFTLADGQIKGLKGEPRRENVRLPEFAQPKAVRGKKIRKPRRERVVGMARTVSKWTWNSVAIAACIHLVALSITWFMRADIEKMVIYVQEVAAPEETATVVAPTPELDELEMPDMNLQEDDIVTPDAPLDAELIAGDPEIETPPDEVFAPQEQVAPPQPRRPMPEHVFRPSGAEGIGGGEPRRDHSGPAKGSGLFRNRQGVSRNAAVRRHGGGKDTENAVNLGLAYLARQQRRDGSWDPNDGFDKRPSWAGPDNGNRGCITALCTLPFLAAGHTPDDGEYKKEVRRAVKWLMNRQTSDGCVSYKGVQQMYTHTVATLALCEAYGLSGDEQIGSAAEHAVRFLERNQGTGGGWDYRANSSGRERNDLSITGWGVLAFKSARAVGIRVNDRHVESLADLYDRLSLPNGETHYADAPHGSIPGSRKGIGMVGVGLASRVILDPGRFEDRNLAAEQRLLGHLPKWERFLEPHHDVVNANFNSFYGLYYGTLGMFLLNNGEGPGWNQWNDALKKTLLKNQVTRGKRRGSWPAADAWIGRLMGDLYSTPLAVLCLEVYYRYNPMHRPDPRGAVIRPSTDDSNDSELEDPVVIGDETLDLARTGDRSRYLRLLVRDKGLGATAKLIDHLSDESLTVRSTALQELAKLKAKDAAVAVQRMLRDPKDRPLRLTVIHTLGRLGEKSAYPSLTELLTAREDNIVQAARSALKQLSDGQDFGTNKRAWDHWFRTNP